MALHRRCTSVRFSIIQPTHTPVRDGRPRVRGRLVRQSVGGIKFLTLFRCAGSLGRRRFTWATRIPSSGQRSMRHLCEHTSLTHLTTSTKYTCGLSTSAANSRDFTVSKRKWTHTRRDSPSFTYFHGASSFQRDGRKLNIKRSTTKIPRKCARTMATTFANQKTKTADRKCHIKGLK